MATFTLKNIHFAGVATCVPKRVISNLTGCKPQLCAEHRRLVYSTGIETQRMAQGWQCFPDLAFDAAERPLESPEWKREEVNALIAVIQSPDYLTSATAIILQGRLGLSHSTVAFDVNPGCSACPFALNLLGSLVAAGGVKKGLVLIGGHGADVSGPTFSDASTAMALESCGGASLMYFDLNGDGSGYKAIILLAGGHREPVGMQHLLLFREDENDHWHHTIDLQLNGAAMLSFSTQHVPPAVEKLLDYAGTSKNEVDYLVFHQANRIINETIRKKLGLSVEKVPPTLRDFGNTSGASLSMTMTVRINRELGAGRNCVLLCGFGTDLSQGICLVDIEGAGFPDLIES